MNKNLQKNAEEFESDFSYGKGIFHTPREWITYFWETHQKRVAAILSKHVENASVLFIGIGTGDVLPFMNCKKENVYGLDINKNNLEEASRYCIPLHATGKKIPLKADSIDVVVCNMVLHHIVGQDSLSDTIMECHRVLKNNGYFFAFEPNVFHPSGIAMNLLNSFRLYNWFAGGSNYEFALSPYKLSKLARKHFSSVLVEGMTYAHPRFPIALQKYLFNIEPAKLGVKFPLYFSFMLRGKK